MSDSAVLEFLAEHDLELSPKPLSRNLNRHGYDIGYSTVRLRVRTLEEHGLLSKDDDGYYEVTEKGQLWLNDELDVEDLEHEEE
nr:winged-helix domain-containing protein [Halobaculum sp. SYNS20]